MNAAECWKELEPSCSEIGRLIAGAPLPDAGKTGLGLLYLAQAISVASHLRQKSHGGSIEANARAMIDLALAAGFPTKAPILAIVPTTSDLEP